MPDPKDPYASPVLMFLTHDVMSRLMNAGGDLHALSKLITHELRELAGARQVSLFRYADPCNSIDPELLYFSPGRSAAIWQEESLQYLTRLLSTLPEPTLWIRKGQEGRIREALDALDSEITLLIPLRHRGELVGGAILLGLTTTEYTHSLQLMIQPLVNIVTLLLRDAVLIEEQEGIIESRTRDLLLSEYRYKMVIETIPLGILVVDREDVISDVNPAASKMYGYSSSQLSGMRVSELFHDQSKKIFSMYSEKVRGGDVVRFDATHQRRNGELVSVDIRACPMKCDEVGQWLMIVTDITEQMRLEEQIRQSEKLNAIGRLAGGVAHDFNNQLMGILGFSELLADELKDSPLREYADRIINSANHSGELTRQLLAFARKSPPVREAVSIDKVLEDVISLVSHSVARHVEIKTDFEADILPVEGNFSQLQNAFLNIAMNACDAMPEGGTISFETHSSLARAANNAGISHRDYIEIVIEDDGIGMDAEVKSRLFEPFFTTKPIGQGTGMGLAAVYGTIQNHGGRIEVDSEPGEGTRMTVRLPVMEDGKVSGDATRSVRNVDAFGILVVDDESNVCDAISQFLEIRHYNVFSCSNGREAIQIFREHQDEISLVILDLVMPELSGRDTFQTLRTLDPDLKVILVSGYTVDEQYKDLLESGSCEFQQKPLSLHRMLDTVAILLGSETSFDSARDRH